MYRCQACNVVVPSNTPSRKVVIETRPKNYPPRKEANRLRIAGKKKPLFTDDPGGHGWEAIKEIKVCRVCYERLSAEESEAAAAATATAAAEAAAPAAEEPAEQA